MAEISLEHGLPASVEAERTILGAILLDNDAYFEAAGTVGPDDFALDSHRRIFHHTGQLLADEKSVDIITLSEHLQETKELDSIGGRPYLFSLTENLPRRLSIADYVRIVKNKSRLRGILSVCQAGQARAADQSEESLTVIGAIQDGIERILDDADGDEPLVSAYTDKAIENFQVERKLDRSPGLSYGIPSLDEFSGGMRKGEVTIVGARSGVGKTSLMCQAAAANCMAGIPCHLFSLEMTREQILRRLWSIQSDVPYKIISEPWRTLPSDVERIHAAALKVAQWPLRIHDQSELHLAKIIGLARVSMRRHGTRFVAVDYAQEVDAEGKDERTKVMAVAKGLTQMVKHENASLMLLSQLVKMSRENYNKPPMVGDLIESGKLENVAHIIVLLHRGWDEESGRMADEAEIIVPKQRRGETGVMRARFSRKTVTFE